MSLADIRREFREIPIALIDEPALPSRSAMDEQRMEELIASIRANGLIQPLSVAGAAGRYEVIAGHRRRIACERAGLAAVPCIVYPSKQSALEAIKYAENRHREELSPADEAIWFHELLERDAGGDVDQLCAQLNEKRGYVEGRLNLLAGDLKIFEALAENKIGVGVAMQLNRCDDELHRRMLLHQAIVGGATVSVVSGWISEYVHLHKHAIGPPSAPLPPATPGPVPKMDFFRCVLCGKDDNVHHMQPMNAHTYCHAAMFTDMLALWNRRHELHAWPRTVQEASDLITDLSERFPEMLHGDPRRI